MATAVNIPAPTETLGQKLKAVLDKLEVYAGDIGLKLENAMALVEKDLPSVTAELNAALTVVLPGSVMPAETVEKFASLGVNVIASFGAALAAKGLNADADQTVAISIAALSAAAKVLKAKTVPVAIAANN